LRNESDRTVWYKITGITGVHIRKCPYCSGNIPERQEIPETSEPREIILTVQPETEEERESHSLLQERRRMPVGENISSRENILRVER